MFLVLVVHAGFFSLQAPTPETFHQSPASSTGLLFFQSLSIGCVNMFVLLSGWFGIRPKVKSFFNFVFQCLFFLIGIYLVCLASGLAELSLRGIAACFVLLKWNWFIKAYIGLYILAPVLNAYVEHSSRSQLGWTLVCFYLFQTIYAWVANAAEFFMTGYSTLSFIGLYLLARYVRCYPSRLTSLPAHYDFLIFAFIVVFQTLLAFGSLYVGVSFPIGRIYNYVSPLVIISSVYLLLGFSKMQFASKWVNWVAASSFAVFLLHTNPNLCLPYFCPMVRWIYANADGLPCLLYLFLFLSAVFVVAILVDQVRIKLWNVVWHIYEQRINNDNSNR